MRYFKLNPRIDSYTRGVKKRENHDWTPVEFKKVYTLRNKGYKSEEIGKMIGVSKTGIYNAVRRAKRWLEKKCLCGRTLTPEEIRLNIHKKTKICNKCRDSAISYKRKLRENALSRNLCCYCHRRPVLNGLSACKKCISATHRRRNIQGLCAICGKNPIGVKLKALCELCANKMRERIRLRRLNLC